MSDENIEEFFKCVLNLVNECDRRFEDADLKVTSYMLSRLQSCNNSLKLLECAVTSKRFDLLPTYSDKVTQTLVLMEKLQGIWLEKMRKLESCPTLPKFSRYKATTLETGKVGRPSYNIDMDRIILLRNYHFKWEAIAKILGVHRTTIWRKIKDSDFYKESRDNNMSEEEIDTIIRSIKNEHPISGERMIIGILRSKGVSVQRWKIRESIHRIDPVNAALRWIQKHPRWIYSVPGPNSLWHNDGLHKLIHWKFVIHACIDGFSRMVTSLICASNNRAETALTGFLSGVKIYGCPARVRGDFGSENVAIAEYMRHQQGYIGAYICGPSVHNQRIERLHYDTTHCVLSHYIDLFLFMEEQEILNRNNVIDLFALHYVYQPKIQLSLDEFKEGWNNHPLSTEKNNTPYQVWLTGMMDSKYESHRGVRTFLESTGTRNDDFGIDPDVAYVNFDNESDENQVEEVNQFDVKLDEIMKMLRTRFPELPDDNNHGILNFCQVRDELIKL